MVGNFRKGLRFPNGIPRAGMSDNHAETDIEAATVAHNGDLRDRVAAVLEEHRQVASSCECGFDLGIAAIGWHWRDHVADAVVASLNLRTDQVGTLTRYVTEWTTNG